MIKVAMPAYGRKRFNDHLEFNDHLDFDRIAKAALLHAAELVPAWLPDRKRHGREWVALNPTRADGQTPTTGWNAPRGCDAHRARPNLIERHNPEEK
jgi:hypothetical protein